MDLLDVFDPLEMAGASALTESQAERVRAELETCLVRHLRLDQFVVLADGVIVGDSPDRVAELLELQETGDLPASFKGQEVFLSRDLYDEVAQNAATSAVEVEACLEPAVAATSSAGLDLSFALFRYYIELELEKWLFDDPRPLEEALGMGLAPVARQLSFDDKKRLDALFRKRSRADPGWIIVEFKRGTADVKDLDQLSGYLRRFRKGGVWSRVPPWSRSRIPRDQVTGIVISNGTTSEFRKSLRNRSRLSHINAGELNGSEGIWDPQVRERVVADRDSSYPMTRRTVSRRVSRPADQTRTREP